jgi:hypothetical protein
MWVHPINIKMPEFGIFSHLYRYLLEDEEKCLGPFRRTSSTAVCHNWWQRKDENKTPTIGGQFHLKNGLQFFFRYVL